jgi:tetratricopeptide (TPR) repeat protein
MKFVTTTAIGAALAITAAGISASPALAKKKDEAPAAAKAEYSPAFRQAAPVAQKAYDAGDYATAKTELAKAQAVATTPDDKYAAAALAYQIATKTNDAPGAATAVDAMLASGKASPEAQKQLLGAQGQNAFNSGNFQLADQAFTQLSQLSPGDGDILISLAAVKTREGKTAQALPIVDQAIQAKKAANQPVPEDWYRRALEMAYDGKPPIPAAVIKYGQGLIAAYPSAQTWRTVLQTYRETNHLDQQTDLDTMRLMRATNSLAGERDYYEYANLANDKGFPGEARAVIDEGVASNMVENKSLATSKALNEIKAIAGSKVAADKAALPALDKRSRTAPDGKVALNTADAYLGYGQYPQAAELYKVALQKGGVDANIVNLRLGIALARSGQKPAAVQAFGTVTGARQPLAQYWTIWSQQTN